MSEAKSPRNGIVCVLLLLLVSATPFAGAQGAVSADILTEWVDDGTGNISHGYRIVLDQPLSFSELDELSVIYSFSNCLRLKSLFRVGKNISDFFQWFLAPQSLID